MIRIGIEGGFSRDHIVNVDHGARFDVPGGPGLYGALASLFTLRWMSAGSDRPDLALAQVRVFGDGADPDTMELLRAEGADLTWMPQLDRAPRLWILTSREGRRIVRADNDGTHELGVDRDDFGAESPTPPGFVAGLAALLRSAPRGPLDVAVDEVPIVAVDPDQRELAQRGWAYLQELAESTTLFLPSRVQLSQLGDDPLRVARRIREETGRDVVARLDSHGSLVLPAAGGAWQVAAADVAVMDTTGAGDCHAAALLTALACAPAGGPDLVRSVAIASLVAALAIGDWGPEALLHDRLDAVGDLADALCGVTTAILD